MDLNKFVIGVLGGALLGTLAVAYGREQKLKNDNLVLRTKWQLATEEFNIAYQMLTKEEQEIVYAKWAANEAYLKTLFPTLDV